MDQSTTPLASATMNQSTTPLASATMDQSTNPCILLTILGVLIATLSCLLSKYPRQTPLFTLKYRMILLISTVLIGLSWFAAVTLYTRNGEVLQPEERYQRGDKMAFCQCTDAELVELVSHLLVLLVIMNMVLLAAL